MNTLRTWSDETGFHKEMEISFGECDQRKEAKTSTILGMLVDNASRDYVERGLIHKVLTSRGQVFLVSRLNIFVQKALKVDSKIVVRTWERGIKRAYFVRDYEILNEEHQLCISATSDWCLVDPNTRSILKPGAFDAKVMRERKECIVCPDCYKIRVQKLDIEKLGDRKIVYSDLDGNGHVYSGKYADIVVDYLPLEYQQKQILSFAINYFHEAKLHDVIEIFLWSDQENIQVYGKKANDICFACEIKFQ